MAAAIVATSSWLCYGDGRQLHGRGSSGGGFMAAAMRGVSTGSMGDWKPERSSRSGDGGVESMSQAAHAAALVIVASRIQSVPSRNLVVISALAMDS